MNNEHLDKIAEKSFNSEYLEGGLYVSEEGAFIRGFKSGYNYPKWVSVEDALPEVNQMVDVYYEEDNHFKRIVNIVYDGIGFIGFKKQKGFVTHWQPLPTPPTK